MSPQTSRALRLAVRASFLAAFAWLAFGSPGTVPAGALRPISAQLHLHGPFSEGIGSIDSHSWEASERGVEVLWWSDHGFRITGFEHVGRFDFEDWRRPLSAGEDWATGRRENRDKVVELLDEVPGAEAAFVSARPAPFEGENSLRLRVTADAEDFVVQGVRLDCERQVHRRPLAARPRVSLAVFPERIGPDARPWVRVALSEHAPGAAGAIEQAELRYHLVERAGDPWREGSVWHVPVSCEAGHWNRLELDLFADVQRGFPSTFAGDNSLHELELGIEARRGATGIAAFDDLVITTSVPADELYAKQRELLDQIGARYPGLVQLQGLEISFLSSHLNEFSVDTQPFDYPAFYEAAYADGKNPTRMRLAKSFNDRLARQVRDLGGILSYNHPFGMEHAGASARTDREAILAELLENQAFGVELLEVGYRDRGGHTLEDHLWLWDQLAAEGLRLVGTGVSDSHGGPTWRQSPNDFVSWLWAEAPAKPELIEALRCGRVFFGDIGRFDGSLDLRTASGASMGDELFTDRDAVVLAVRLEGVREPSTLRFVRDGVVVRDVPLEAGDSAVEHETAPSRANETWRVEVHDREGTGYLFSNPVHLLRTPSGRRARPARTRIDVAGLRSISLDGPELESIRADEDEVRLTGRWRRGTLILDLTDFDGEGTVRWEGVRGTARREGATLELSDVRGSGVVVLGR